MPTLIVRNIDAELVQRLRFNAVEHGRSAEEEHREILRKVLGQNPVDIPDFKELMLAIPEGDEDVFPRDRTLGRAIEL